MSASRAQLLESITNENIRKGIPAFRTGDTLKVHAKIVEGQKERVQIFEGIVIKRHKGNGPSATFTVRKVSYNIGVERTFLLHSPRIEKIEVISKGSTRRARLFHLRPLRGKAARIKSTLVEAGPDTMTPDAPAQSSEAPEGTQESASA